MVTAREIEKAIVNLPSSELKALREWFAQYDAENWDTQFESDIKKGKLVELGKRALSQHAKQQTKEI